MHKLPVWIRHFHKFEFVNLIGFLKKPVVKSSTELYEMLHEKKSEFV